MTDIILLTSFNAPDSDERTAEYEECLERNCETRIDRIIVFFEGSREDMQRYPGLLHDKVDVIRIDERPLLSRLFRYANDNLAGHFIIVSNADIYFEKYTCIDRIREIKQNHMWALTRYSFYGGDEGWKLELDGMQGSYDSYVFRAAIREFKSTFSIGAIGSDTYLVQQALAASIWVANPSLSLVSRHLDSAWYPDKYLDLPKGTEYWSMGDFRRYERGIILPSHIEDAAYLSKLHWRYILMPLFLLIEAMAQRMHHFYHRPYYRKRVYARLTRRWRRWRRC